MAHMATSKPVFLGDELTVVLGASGVYALRMLGLYMALPIMSTWAAGLPGATPFLVGLALGAYGLTQAIFQVPAGLLGDVRGRRVVILGSLVIFAIGCGIVAFAPSIHFVILGRLVQGVGAMASTLIALIGDATREEVRTRGMALMGGVLGVAFAGGFLLGPLVSSKAGVPAVFGLAGLLSLVGALLFEVLVPRRLIPGVRDGGRHAAAAPFSWAEARSLLHDRSLLVLDSGIAVLHAALTGVFVVLPFVLNEFLKPLELWKVYAPVLACGFIAMVWGSHQSDRRSRTRFVLRLGAFTLSLGMFGLTFFHRTFWITALSLGVFVIGFAMIEPTLASLVTRFTGRTARGTAAGLFNMSQFGGAFLGGALAGFLMKYGRGYAFLALGLFTLGWAFTLAWMRNPEDIADSAIDAPELDGTTWAALRERLVAHPAILEAEWSGRIVTIRHWARLVSRDDLSELVHKR
jgi:MFS family permease